MKKVNRTTLFCAKKLQCGVLDKFEVVVKSQIKEEAKKRYESMGYAVSEKR